jgi:predicted nucleic acid-binding protein
MLVVSDADIIIHLAKLGRLKLLRSLYDRVSIPEVVRQEITSRPDRGIDEAIGSFLSVHPGFPEKAEVIAARHGIHHGEAHVKALAESLNAEVFLSNERKVRKAAVDEGFRVAGTIGVILRAARIQVITINEARDLLEMMKSEDYRIHPDLIQEAIKSLDVQ